MRDIHRPRRQSERTQSSRRRRRRETQHESAFVEAFTTVLAVLLLPAYRALRGFARACRKRPLTVIVSVVAAVLLVGGITTGIMRLKAEREAAEAVRAAEAAESAAAAEAEYQAETINGSKSGITYTAPRYFVESDALAQLKAAIDTFEANGYSLSFTLYDYTTGYELDYNEEVQHYSASSIKAPYCVALYSTADTNNTQLNASERVQNTIMYSDNDSYTNLRNVYGNSLFRQWIQSSGLSEERAAAIAANHYANLSALELGALWTESYYYLTSGSDRANELASYLSDPLNSVIHALVSGTYTSWTKPGWYPSGDDVATNDAGIVRSDTGDYLLVIMSNAPQDFDSLIRVADALNQAHGALTGGATTSLITEQTQIPSADE